MNAHWHMPSALMNRLARGQQYRANCFDSNNNYERLWNGVSAYSWGSLTPAASSTSLDGGTGYATYWASHHFGLVSGDSEAIAIITAHTGNQWACAGNAGPGGEGYTGRGGVSNLRLWLR